MTAATPADAIEALAAACGQSIPPAYRDGVAAQYAQLMEQAALVLSVAPPDQAEAAAEFEP